MVGRIASIVVLSHLNIGRIRSKISAGEERRPNGLVAGENAAPREGSEMPLPRCRIKPARRTLRELGTRSAGASRCGIRPDDARASSDEPGKVG